MSVVAEASVADEIRELVSLAQRLLALAEGKANGGPAATPPAELTVEARYPSPFIDRIHELVETDEGYQILDRSKNTRGGNSYETATRVLAFLRQGYTDYKYRTKEEFIESECRYWYEHFAHNPLLASTDLEVLFTRAVAGIDLTLELLGSRATSKKGQAGGPSSGPMIEIMVYEMARRHPDWLRENVTAIGEAYERLVASPRFQAMIGSNTFGEANTRRRFVMWAEMLDAINDVISDAIGDDVQIAESEVAVDQPTRERGDVTAQERASVLRHLVQHPEYQNVGCYRCEKGFEEEDFNPVTSTLEMIWVESGVAVMHAEATCRKNGWK